jgi:diguanylate cyclase (GGDEF)-like protein/PAS domain S-box-containing protein
MRDALRILFVDDEELDVVLARRLLERDGIEFEWRLAVNEAELRRTLAEFEPDVVLCDYTIPGYSGVAALELIHHERPDIPVLFVSGTIAEELAIACLEHGAADYLLKSNLRRLGAAVRRAVSEARERARARGIEESSVRLTELLEASADMVVMSDAEGRITYVNDTACRLLGTTRESLLGREFEATYWPRDAKRVRSEVLSTAMETGTWQGVLSVAAPDGTAITTSQVVTAHRGADGRVQSFSAVGRDLRDREAYEARIHQLAHYDTLTGLPNLAHINELIGRSTAAARENKTLVALANINLDRFRLIDEGFGRSSADEILKSVGSSLTGAVRERDAVARVGHDEFLVVLSGLADHVEATVVLQRMLDSIASPRRVAGQEIQITATAGLAVYPHDGSDFETLLRKAGAAMHAAKSDRRGGFRLHSGDVERHAKSRLRLETDLRNAILHHQLAVHYQPQFEVRSGRMCGVEALARWFPHDGESIAPAVFVPLAEQTGLISALGAFVLQNACSTVANWHLIGDRRPTLGINVSTHQICREFRDVLAHALEVSGFPPHLLELEITESVLMNDTDLALECLAQWKRLGVRIAVDDFGTGYSGLNYLSRLPVDRLKMDKSLIRGMTTASRDATIVRAVIGLGRELGITVLAEGVETMEQLAMLRDLGCQQAQGFLFSEPKCAEEARQALRARWGVRAPMQRRPSPRPYPTTSAQV